MKYIIHPGPMESKVDGDIHFITAGQLIKLYGVDPKDCIIREMNDRRREIDPEKCKHLYPLYNGDYSNVIQS